MYKCTFLHTPTMMSSFSPVLQSCSTLRLSDRFSANVRSMSGSAWITLGRLVVVTTKDPAVTAGRCFEPRLNMNVVLDMK